MNEQICEFGPGLNLVGILTEPESPATHADAPCVVMLNAGLLHRVGPHRMSVELGRRLARCGISSFRFDIGGRGDSESAKTADSDEAQINADITSALDFLEARYQLRKFVPLGLCTGSDNAHATALRDPRVVGIVHLDGHGYKTWRSNVEHYLPRLSRPQAWVNFARRNLSASEQLIDEAGVLDERKPFGPKPDVEREIQSLVDRGTQLLYIYTGGVAKYYNYAGQFFDMFEGLNPRGLIEVEHYPNADHTYTFAEDRERMFDRVIDWCCSRDWTVTENQPDTVSA
jgi:dienelactone hydrolase